MIKKNLRSTKCSKDLGTIVFARSISSSEQLPLSNPVKEYTNVY